MSQAKYAEHDLSATHDGLALSASLTLPLERSAQAVLLLLPGSGQLDRNQNSPTMELNIFNQLAEQLAIAGFASVRFDKRGCGASDGDYNATGHSDLVADAQAWLRAINKHALVSELPVFLLGHSEGTLIAPQLCLNNSHLRGQILLCPFLQNIEVVIERQLNHTLEEIRNLEGFKGAVMRFYLWFSGDQIKKQRDVMARIRRSNEDTIRVKKQIINAKWLRELSNIEPVDIHARVTTPTLAIGGSKDVQCLPTDVDDLRGIMPIEPDTHLLENLTHILRPDADVPTTQRYRALAKQPLDERVVDVSVQWLRRQLQ